MALELQHVEILGLLLVPAIAAVIVALLGPERRALIRWISVVASCLTLLVAVTLTGRFMHLTMTRGPEEAKGKADPTFRPQFVPGAWSDDIHNTSWNLLRIGSNPQPRDDNKRGSPAIQFFIGIDGLNIWLILLTAVLMLPSVLISWNHIEERVNEFYAWLMLLQTAMLGIFLSFDIVLFYAFFELSLVPLFFLIGIWGGPERRYAARKFFIYTLTGSLITLLGVIGVVIACYDKTGELTFSIPRLVEIVHTQLSNTNPDVQAYWGFLQRFVFLALMVGFAVKVPLVPLHTWLPLAHVEAPTAGSVDLAGILLKIGAYGFLRLCIPLAPDASLALGLPLVSGLAAVGVVYGAFCAYSQDDIKRLVAYSSVSHLGLCMLGMFALNPAGLSGSLLQMINHGLSTGLLFLLVGMLYERYHTRKISDFGGMARRLPLLGVIMVFTCLSSVGLPGLNGFVGEVLVLLGVFEQQYARQEWPVYAVIGSTGIVLGAWYLFTMLRRVFFGPVKEPALEDHEPIRDLDGRELTILIPLCVLCLVLGLYPQPFLETAKDDVMVVTGIADKARERAARPPFSQRLNADTLQVSEADRR